VEALTNRFRDDVGWRDPNGWSALGLAHGSAGIAFAAAGFASQTRCEKAKELAVKALQFDRRFYLNRENNWPVLAREQNASMSAWCAGLPGMLLARLAVAEISDHPRLLDEIHRILRNFPEQSGLDFWCCGALGLAEVLLFAATRLQRPDLQTKAQTMLSSIIERALPTCYFRLSRSAAENYCFQPSLFRGFSGVAYSALRFGSSGKIPSILAFEIGAN
jgi:lantibiotic modifying enzyme